MDYAVHNVPSYQHMQGSASPAHMGSKSHTSSTSGPITPSGHGLGGGGAVTKDPGGSTRGKIGSGAGKMGMD